jgi:large subunit ribosomal protein L5
MSLVQTYNEEIAPKLMQEFGLKSNMAAPRVTKVVINMGIGLARDSRDEQEKIVAEMTQIAGQRPNIRHARLAIAGFGIRKGQPVGVAVTLRGQRMYDFLQKLFNIVLPRLRDFRGVSRKSFDAMGNYTLGMSEHSVFPEIDLGKINKVRSLEITIVTSTGDREKSMRLLEELGMPFEKEGENQR